MCSKSLLMLSALGAGTATFPAAAQTLRCRHAVSWILALSCRSVRLIGPRATTPGRIGAECGCVCDRQSKVGRLDKALELRTGIDGLG